MALMLKGGLAIAVVVSFIIAVSTGSAAIAEAKKGTKPSANPLKGEIISSVIFCCLCMCLAKILQSIM